MDICIKHIKIQGRRPSAPKGNSTFEVLLVKIFSLKQKTNQILPATTEKIKFCLFKKTVHGSFKQEITFGKCIANVKSFKQI